MSRAACAKKLACNPPVLAAVDSAERIIFEQLQPALDAGDITEPIFRELVLAFAQNDINYCQRHEQIVADCIEALGGL